MTTIDIDDTENPGFAGAAARASFLEAVARLFRRLRQRRRERETLTELGRMNAYLLRDMGIEPGDVFDALDGRRSSLLFNPLRKPQRH